MNTEKLGWITACLACPLLILAFLLAYTKPFPVWETWYFIDTWRLFALGGDWVGELFTIRWGHIHALPNLVNLLVGHVSCYSMKTDGVVTWLVALLALWLIVRQLPRSAWVVLGMTSALFTTRLAEVWLNSWNLMWSLSLLQSACIATCLARPGWKPVLVAAVIGASGIVTAGQGLAIVAAGCIPLALQAWRDRRRWPQLLAWCVYTALAGAAFSRLSGSSGGTLDRLLALDLTQLSRLLAFGLGEGEPYQQAFLLLTGLGLGLAIGLGQARRDQGAPAGQRASTAASDLFWAYMVAALLIFAVLLAIARPGQVLSRYIMFLWIAPTALVYLLHRVSEGRRLARGLLLAACAGWAGVNLYNSYRYFERVQGWEPISQAVVNLARNNPNAVRAEMLKGVAAEDVALVAKGLETMRSMSVNIYCRRDHESRGSSRHE